MGSRASPFDISRVGPLTVHWRWDRECWYCRREVQKDGVPMRLLLVVLCPLAMLCALAQPALASILSKYRSDLEAAVFCRADFQYLSNRAEQDGTDFFYSKDAVARIDEILEPYRPEIEVRVTTALQRVVKYISYHLLLDGWQECEKMFE